MDTKNYKIVLTDSAKIDLEEIYKYIAERLIETATANKIMKRIEKEILLLEDNPYRCIEVMVKPHKKKYRKLVIGKYIVLYRIIEDSKEIVVDNIIYGKRDYLI